ncbi:MAG: Asp-tRNA(Asn)/Glu-tRNA(Gln) amidotransferase GatCAB subunit A [Candidatus Vogelbacteria bacterium CG10_big_fil_rev_8_21_14_0_10_49_38]|uniref:Glutamyl-tRNA(Gln) amidotransferase subunit A n=1 Tax=Candidatus Vogelbacteria bacterium CG10_big_fil_rev_8_21_14_0_10_49_38 TaxID=1975043 RepID=A0A2H0RIH2_9BACT|nr:MAG: glutaminyl-tRNA synthase (glutamine-hydrolyzing) subunit A [bacterium CG10_49_38]PIR46339.1 MAG: Asp-tRNA(Asn)/Glu-tRNA(Gln) amidotransferase GatCAB subunit A [Candidatus Vogelbacteria bacterium CG10_big_fil_rev_8_21_14_0_10_49_38]
MTKIDLDQLTIVSAQQALRRGDWSALELTEAYLTRIADRDPELHAYLEVFADAKTQAQVADRRFKEGTAEPLTGIPLAIKDNILIKDRVASAASKMLENYRAVYDATVIDKLKKQGAVFLGRTNMDEFAMGGSTENSAYGPTKNPVDETRVSGGSSGGSAAAVAAGLALAALGSDTGGSIRQPAAFCGTVGFKPTYGAVSRYGLMSMASSLDQIGPLARTVADAEAVFAAIRGRDPFDATSFDFAVSRSKPKKSIKIGVPESFLGQGGIDKEVLDNFSVTLDKLKEQGVEAVKVDLPSLKYALASYYVLMPAEVSANLARFDGMRYGAKVAGADLLGDYLQTRGQKFGSEVRRRIMLGTYVLSAGYYDAYYRQADRVRELIRLDYATAFGQVDLIATPTTPTPAFALGEKIADPLQMYLEDIFTVPINLAGLPGLSVPSGQGSTGLPLGLQLVAPWREDDFLLRVGKMVEECQA